jgi:hypothetical protein
LTDMSEEAPLSIQDAHHLMEVLDKDIPDYDKRQVALLLLILAADPSRAQKGEEVVGYSPRTSTWIDCYGDGDDFYGCYGC